MREKTKDSIYFLSAIGMLVIGALAFRTFIMTRGGGSGAGGPSQNTYVGHYGFSLTLPPETAKNYQMFGAFTNAQKTAEVVFVFPRGMDNEQPFKISEERYKEFGIVRMEVNPNKNFPGGTDLVAAAKYAVGTTLKEKKEKFQMQDIAEPLPGFVVQIETPTALNQVFLKGQKVHYLVTAAVGNPLLGQVLEGLAEISPHDDPGK